ncbi:YecA family protein [Nitrosomonas mobilis]|nr:SEC-C domain-containing protein [Nitrosomonas mobilis]
MKPGRNDPCPCGSDKKYKHCCIDSVSKQHAEVFDEIAQIVAMNPNLTLDELNLVAEQQMHERNTQPDPDFCGLSSTQMANWLYAPFNELAWVTISIPDNLSSSPVMRYLALILDEAMQQEGSFKATSGGNLPAKLVKQACDLLPEFAVAEYETMPSISEYMGSNEDRFNALHYTRILAEIAGIICHRSGRFHIKKEAQKQFQTHGVKAFFLPMLDAAITKYNWGYLDGWEDDVDLRTYWLFMLWRLQSHSSVDQLIEEVATAFPDLVRQYPSSEYRTPQEQLGMRIESRFIERFLQFWGFVTVDPRRMFAGERVPRKVDIQPLLMQTFRFGI